MGGTGGVQGVLGSNRKFFGRLMGTTGFWVVSEGTWGFLGVLGVLRVLGSN